MRSKGKIYTIPSLPGLKVIHKLNLPINSICISMKKIDENRIAMIFDIPERGLIPFVYSFATNVFQEVTFPTLKVDSSSYS